MISSLLWLSLASAGEPVAPVAPPAFHMSTDAREMPSSLYEGVFDRPPNPHWSRALPGGRLNAASHTELARPVVVGESILVGSAAAEALYKLDRRDGSVAQSYPAAGSVDSEALVVGEYVFFSDTGGYTWCYRLDGTKVWSHQGNAPVLVRPTFHQGTLFVTNVDDLVVALEAGSGELQWRHQQKPDLNRTAELSLYAAPPAKVFGDDVLVGFSTGDFVALDRRTGDLQWSERIGAGRYPDIVAEPSIAEDLILVSGYFEPLVALDSTTRRVQWTLEKGSASGALVAKRGERSLVYHPGTDGVLRAVDVKSGDLHWSWPSGQSGALSTPVLTEAGLLIGSSSGSAYLLDADTGSQLWSYAPGFVMEGVTSAPVVAGRQLLFISNAGILYSFLAPTPSVDWPETWPANRRQIQRVGPRNRDVLVAEEPTTASEE